MTNNGNHENNHDNSDSQYLRSLRHNPCLMAPISGLMVFIFAIFSLLTLLFKMPELLLGFILSPILGRTQWFVEFLYPTGLARWGHLYLMKVASGKKEDENHSRCLEQRIEMVTGRIFCHPIPQLLDNLGYLVVCVPQQKEQKIVAFLVDCGDARAAHNVILDINDLHYPDQTIELHAILATHKHHDHTAGNKEMLKDVTFGPSIKHIFGGAVEHVPHCNNSVANGDILPLPKVDGNDMNEFVEVEVVAVPGHTRGSVAYVMRSKVGDPLAFCFTGDTMFSAGDGVPFEADLQPKSDLNLKAKTQFSYIRASAGSNAVERCFAEILVRASKHAWRNNQVLIFPGHEYTSELLNRQFLPSAGETSHWNKMAPSVFFDTAAHLFVSQHRRTLPKGGKLLTVPSPLARELVINPTLRKMKRRGEDVIKALQLWHALFNRPDLANHNSMGVTIHDSKQRRQSKTQATQEIWTLDVNDVCRSVFTTVFTSDLEQLIEGLATGKLDRATAVHELKNLKTRLNEPLIGRRPIPGTIPTERIMYQAILGFCLLGSPPSALTMSDSRLMKLRAPVNPTKTDTILISKTRILTVLQALLLIPGDESSHVVEMIHSLWAQASASSTKGSAATDAETHPMADEITLGTLKWMLYGIDEGQAPSSLLCRPCKAAFKPPVRDHPIHKSLRKTNGELVRHDLHSCPICRDATGSSSDPGVEGKADVVSCTRPVLAPIVTVEESVNSDRIGQPREEDDLHGSTRSFERPWVGIKTSMSMPDGPWDENHDDSDAGGVEIEMAKSFPF